VTEPSSRDRLISAALRLFAEHGYARTSVGQIEAAAGFTARGGTVYKHFASKQHLLQAALDHHVRVVTSRRPTLADLLPLGDLHAESVLLMRYLLGELADHRDINALIEKEGAEHPFLPQRFWDDIADPGYRAAGEVFGRQLDSAAQPWDSEALSAVIVGALVNYRRSEWTFGHTPLDVDEQRIVDTLARLIDAAARADGATVPPRKRRSSGRLGSGAQPGGQHRGA
jgi:AcrR family transcriptional regulator